MRQIAGETKSTAAITGTPSGAAGLDMTSFLGTARARTFLVSITTDASTDIVLWGALEAGAIDTASDDVWGTHQDRHGVYADGKIGTALAAGTHHRLVDDLGAYTYVAFVKSNGSANVTVRLTELLDTTRGG